MKKLIIPKTKQTKGLFVFCSRCRMKSKTQLMASDKCSHPIENLKYKAVVGLSGTTKYRSLTLKSRQVDVAIKECVEFEKKILRNSNLRLIDNDQERVLPQDFVGCVQMYFDYLDNKNVFEHQRKERSVELIKQIKRYLRRFVIALVESGVKVRGMQINDISNAHVAVFHSYIMKKYNPANRTYNRHMDTLSELFRYLIEKKQYNVTNYFSSHNVVRKRTSSRILTVSIEKFHALLESITEANGVQTLNTGEKKYHYQRWLRDAFELALLTGGRRDEIINMKYSDIVEVDGRPAYIKREDYKYNRRNNLLTDEEKKYNYSPITSELKVFLNRAGYFEFKGEDRYIIASDSNRARNTLKENMSKAFTHYYKLLDPDGGLQFKCLRKTYITLLNNFTNGGAEVITGHSGQEIIMKSYHDSKIFSDTIDNFRMIS